MDLEWRTHHLHGLAVNYRKRGAPRFVATNDFCNAQFQCRDIQRALAMHGERFIVERAVWRKLSMQPHLLLSKSERNRRAGRAAWNCPLRRCRFRTPSEILLQEFVILL